MNKPIDSNQPINKAQFTETSTMNSLTEESGIDIWEYIQIIRRRWLLIVLSVLVVVGLTAFITLRMTKIYRATTTIRIETQAPQVLGKGVEDVVEMGTGSFWTNVEYYETQYRIIESRSVLNRVVVEYKLNEDPDFLKTSETKRATFKPVSLEEASLVLLEMLTVEPIKDSRLVLLHVDHKNPKLAQLYSNAIARAYEKQNLSGMLQNTVDAVDWLSQQLDEARKDLNTSEQDLRKYKKDKQILSISLEDRQNLIAAQMTESARRLTEAKAHRIEIQAKKNAIKKASKVTDPMAIPIESLNSNSLIQQLKQNFATLSQEYGELSARYGDNFPKIIELNAKMDRIRTDIAREVNNIIRAVDSELNVARSTEVGLTKALEDYKLDAQELADKEGGYNKLARSIQNNEQIYELLLGRTKEADLSKLLRVNNVEVLDGALEPKVPIKPRIYFNLALSFFFGLILGIGLAIVIEFSDRTIKTQDDVENMGISFLGIVPSIDSSRITGSNYYSRDKKKKRKKRKSTIPSNLEKGDCDIFVHNNPKSQVAENLRSIRTNLLFMSADNPIKRLLITSPSPQEGKTTVACNLAIIMAQSGSRILLVDTDMRKPRVHKAFDIIRPTKGLSTMILGKTTAAQSIQQTVVPNLDVLVCGPIPPNPSELIHTESFRRVIKELSSLYDRVIFDSPPVGVVTDAAILSTMVDGALLVVKCLKTTKESGQHAINVMRGLNAEILGAVLNDLDLNDRKYGQYYYYYYKKYGYYYGENDGENKNSIDENSSSKINTSKIS